jgi:hypothetical protein
MRTLRSWQPGPRCVPHRVAITPIPDLAGRMENRLSWGGFRSFVATAANGEVAPIPAVPVTSIVRLKSTLS